MHRFEYFKPQTIQEAITLMEKFKGEAIYVAGGTDVMVQVRQKKVQPKAQLSFEPNMEIVQAIKGLSKPVDESCAREEFGWAGQYPIERTIEDFLKELNENPEMYK